VLTYLHMHSQQPANQNSTASPSPEREQQHQARTLGLPLMNSKKWLNLNDCACLTYKEPDDLCAPCRCEPRTRRAQVLVLEGHGRELAHTHRALHQVYVAVDEE
jgi:hypothetical protein